MYPGSIPAVICKEDMNICLHLDLNYLDSSDPSELDREYQNGLKKLLKVLCANKSLVLSIAIPGAVLEYYSDKFPEAIQILRELVEREQVEIIGCGFYAPILPLLIPSNRSLQLEKNTSLVRTLIGKRPRGVSLFGSIYDSSLVQVLKSCGFEYLVLDDSLLEDTKSADLFVVSQHGKTIKVVPSSKSAAPQSDETFSQWISRYKSLSDGKNEIIRLDLETIGFLTDKKFLSELLASEDISLVTSMNLVKGCQNFKQIFIQPGMEKIGSFKTIFDFLYDNPQSLHVYERIVYLNMLLSQVQGKDKMRKKAAQENVLEAQRGSFLISLVNGKVASPRNRQNAYKLLCDAEKNIRESGYFVEALTNFDYDGDGYNEYVYQADNFNSTISQKGGRISDLNVLSNGSNYTDFYSTPENSFFVESLWENCPSRNLSEDADLDFQDAVFTEKKFDGKRKEIFLETEKTFSSLNLPVQLQKKIIASSTGFVVQYILKNLSPFQLKTYFLVSINLAATDFSSKTEKQYDMELIQEGNRIKNESSILTLDGGVSMLQISDSKGKIAMLFEPNEEAGFIAESFSSENIPEERAEKIKFFWPVDLASGRAMEKTINFVLIPLKKNRK